MFLQNGQFLCDGRLAETHGIAFCKGDVRGRQVGQCKGFTSAHQILQLDQWWFPKLPFMGPFMGNGCFGNQPLNMVLVGSGLDVGPCCSPH